MASNTPVLALPYPTPDDNVDVPRDVKALADKIDAISALRPPVVSTLPGSPADGQEIYYLADATKGIVWHFRYRAASGSIYKWEFLGGPALSDFVAANEVTTQTNWTDLPTVGPSVMLALNGEYDAEVMAEMYGGANIQGVVTPMFGGLPPGVNTNGAVMSVPAGASSADSSHSARIIAELPAGATRTIRSVYRQAGSGGTGAGFLNRRLSVRPIRVG